MTLMVNANCNEFSEVGALAVWEADEVARCIFEGKLESPQMPLRETVLMMQV